MAVSCPALEWPNYLDECGPAEDPTILLSGTARIGGTPVAVVAIRINPGLRRCPDYRKDLPAAVYETGALEAILEELEYMTEELSVVTGSGERSIVDLAEGRYAMWVLPAR
jgi:hypothetical protein